MPNTLNKAIVSEYETLFEGDLDAIFVQPVGMSVDEANTFRAKLAEDNLAMRVVRGRLAARVLEAKGVTGVDEMFAGPSALISSTDKDADAVAISAAKVVAAWKKESGTTLPAIKGGFLEGEVLDAAAADKLKTMPSRPELMSRLSGQIIAPAGRLASQLTAAGGRIAGAVKTHIENLEKAG
jgi:large subunit ribosomal protein L10